MVAAATTSLPETPGGERNWDYRYAWIRDSTFMLWGLYTLGFDEEANDFFYFIADVAGADEELQIMYGIGGERELTEEMLLTTSTATSTPQPVRIGNGAYDQQQHDVWGALLDSIYLHTKLARRAARVDVADPRAARSRRRSRHWREPDRGIWEVRGEPKHFTSSKVMCWVACDRGARLARLREDCGARRALAGGRRRDPRRRARARRRRARRVRPALRHRRRSTPRACCSPLVRFLPPDDQRDRRDGQRDRRRAHRRRPRAALPHRRDRRRPAGRGGHVRDLLVLAGERAGRDRRARPRPRAVRAAARLRVARWTSTPRRSTRARAATWATSRRRSRTSRSSTRSCT